MKHTCLTPFLLALLLGLFTGCRQSPTAIIPTRIASPEQAATEIVQTQNAPPEGFRQGVAFDQIDANLPSLSNWRYDMTLQFDGVFSNTPRPAAGFIRMQTWFNQLGSQRRVVIDTRGELFGVEDDAPVTREAVRLGPDTYLVENNACRAATEGEPALAADLLVSQLIGGISRAVPPGMRAVINGQQVWRFDFTEAELLAPYLRLGETGRIISLSGELWVAPEHNVVVRFWVTMTVENAVLFENVIENTPPVSGEIILRYDLYDIGLDPNITQPFGC